MFTSMRWFTWFAGVRMAAFPEAVTAWQLLQPKLKLPTPPARGLAWAAVAIGATLVRSPPWQPAQPPVSGEPHTGVFVAVKGTVDLVPLLWQ
ncbi:MAG: hypothetical protein A2X58_03265 [Nitrospirae bacterium GWC2_56_14]|nr:MAG: hypothetical protein A2X58_03265 [Nitrospirae bacterium GWC2_56_14]